MTPTSAPPIHPCQYSPQVIDAIRPHLRPGDHVHDPFAGTGHRLAELCDTLNLGVTYSGADIEDWPGHDPRVAVGDATDPASYPQQPFVIVTSPVYLNKRLADYADGPGPNTVTRGRRDYGISLGRALHPRNLARHTGKPSRADAYWQLHGQAVEHWDRWAIVNVDQPISGGWVALLSRHGYRIDSFEHVRTPRYRGLANADRRADVEVLIVACRSHAA